MSLDTYYAPEVEEALVSLCWHKPELLGKVLRSIDPGVHILQPHLRFILEAIDLAYRHLNTVDFASVVQSLREDGLLESCGDLGGLDSLYSCQKGYECMVGYYIDLLVLYSTKRSERTPVAVFSGGKGSISLNKSKSKDGAPDYCGTAFIRGRKYKIAGWTASDRQGIAFSFYAQ